MSIHPEEQRRRPGGLGRGLLAAILAVALHFAFAGLLVFFSLVQLNVPDTRPPPPRAVSLRPLSSQQWAQNRGEASRSGKDDQRAVASRTPEPKKEEPKKDPIPRGQVVDVAPGNQEEAPDAKYLAESANRVKKESRAKDQTPLYRNAMPRHTSTAPQQGSGKDNVEQQQLAGNNGMGDDDRPLREPGAQKGMFEVPDVKARQEVALKSDSQGQGPGTPVTNQSESEAVQGNSTRLKIQPGDPGQGSEQASPGRAGQAGVANLMPSMAVLDKISGAAPNDSLREVAEGEGTFLNTKEWKYSGFFNRVKQSVGMHWDPSSQLRQRDPSGTIYGGRDRYTVLGVTLTDKGRVKDIFVERSSGVEFLDLEAIHSFERAQPFPNPPPGLAAADSTVHFSFGFFLEMGGGPRMRLFRQSN